MIEDLDGLEGGQRGPVLDPDELQDSVELSRLRRNTDLSAIGRSVPDASGDFANIRLAPGEPVARPEPVGGAHVVVLVEAVGAGAALLREVAARAVVVRVCLGAAGDRVPAQAEAEWDDNTRVCRDVGPVDPCAEIAVGTLEGAEVDGGGGRQEGGEDGELGGEAGETHGGDLE